MAAATEPQHPSSDGRQQPHHPPPSHHHHPNRDFAAWRARLSARLAALGPDQVPVVLVACGSFNPPTRAHLRLFSAGAAAVDGAKARETSGGDGEHQTLAVVGGLLSPVGDGYGKAGLAPAAHRLAMCALATEVEAGGGSGGGGGGLASSSPAIDVCVHGWEATREGGRVHTRTLDVLRHIESELNDQGEGTATTGGEATTATAPARRPRVRAMLLAGTDLVESMRRPGVWSEPDALLREHGVVCVERPGHGVAAAPAPAAADDDEAAPAAVDLEALISSCVLHAECEEEFMTGVSSSRAREALCAALGGGGDEAKGATAAATTTTEARARAAASDARVADLLDPRVAEYAALNGLYCD
jgi:nicotinic acid mononucleotide adenylyltransferase